ncbi:hypothetical protein GCM10011360_14460 [Primorskyibacter flagellatus]|uniref:BioF2-like acetyltransferase domain-containing protein n=1 Tax=Primorskyibacter flagellatus TaxID=1387277 RepID=A0A917A5X7_9RHOB|nr:GNAT family N-acetyltransferase [Primorskyibacter flagellatus]GGE27260.1 hypothetical protein GCM10011360_14460 [Primorskyibacter flagellatus]
MSETPRPLQQSVTYARALRRMGREVIRIGPSCAPCQFAIVRRAGPLRLAYLPRGAVPDWRDVFCGGGPGLCLVIPDTAPTDAPGCPFLTPQHVAELDLGPDTEALWNGLHGKWRNRLRRGLEGPVVVVQERFDLARHAGLLGREEAQRKQRSYRTWPRSFLTAFAATSPDDTILLRAVLGGETVAFVLLLVHGTAATYAVGWSGPTGRSHQAHTRLLWEAALHLRARGVIRFDLGPVDSEAGAPRARFKLGCGAKARPLGPTLLVPRFPLAFSAGAV